VGDGDGDGALLVGFGSGAVPVGVGRGVPGADVGAGDDVACGRSDEPPADGDGELLAVC
jgi:hypothetical protein